MSDRMSEEDMRIRAVYESRLEIRSIKDIAEIERNREAIAELVEALKGAVRVADRQTDEFDMARALITKYGD